MSEDLSKAALNLWCSKKKLGIKYDIQPMRGKLGFECKIYIDTLAHNAFGSGKSKRDASNEAALNYLNFLVDQKFLSKNELSMPCFEKLSIKDKLLAGSSHDGNNSNCSARPSASAFRPHQPNRVNPPPPPPQFGHNVGNRFWNEPTPYMSIPPPIFENGPPENVDMPAGYESNAYDNQNKRIRLEGFGNFTPDNAKQQLNQFLQAHRIKADYQYEFFGPTHKQCFYASLRFTLPSNRRIYHGREMGSNKNEASRACALNLLHQLYQDGMVQDFQPDAPSKRQLLKSNFVYQLNVDPQLKALMNQAYSMVSEFNQYTNNSFNSMADVNSSLAGYGKAYQTNDPNPTSSTYLYWCPPMPDLNPWTGSKPDPPYADKTKEEINETLQREFMAMIKVKKFQDLLKTRVKLPIWPLKDRVIELVENNKVVIIKGSTGCGKTTQVPQFILDSYLKSGKGAECNIIVTQPRRISAMSVAERIATERLETFNTNIASVGYSVRFDHIHPRPYGAIEFCTTGHLLRKLQSGLKGVSHVIIDEAHERDINTDLLLIIIRDLVSVGLDLHVIIMSATIDTTHFVRYFNNCPVIELDSALFPVQKYYLEDIIQLIKWRPPRGQLTYAEEDIESEFIETSTINVDSTVQYYPETINALRRLKEGAICYELIVSILEHIHEKYLTGAVLVFLPGWNSIFFFYTHLRQHPLFGKEDTFLLLPLHSQLSNKDNHRIFQPSNRRKIILATNIAETSITIDDVVFVVDTCLVKKKTYSPRNNVTSYTIDWVSKANIQQRSGRAGRVRSGYYFALLTQRRYKFLDEFKIPEILTCSLIETCLLIKYLGFGSVREFLNRALDLPPIETVQEAIRILQTINAFTAQNELTPLGYVLAKMPIDPRFGRMVMQGILLGVPSPALTIAAASSVNIEVFDTADLNLMMRTMVSVDEERYSDHLVVLKVFNKFENNPAEAYRHAVNANAINEIRRARRQLQQILKHSGFDEFMFEPRDVHRPEDYGVLVGLLITSFYPNICIHKEARRILTNEERIGIIHKTSVLYSYLNTTKKGKALNLLSPLFVYSEKTSNNNLISSKQMSMISFLHLLLFGIKKYELPTNSGGSEQYSNTILLDGWIEMQIDPSIFDYTFVIKSELENILARVCVTPKSIQSLTPIETLIVKTVKEMCAFHNLSVKMMIKN